MENYPILKYFEYKHLPKHLQEISKSFCELANKTAKETSSNPETAVALRKLLEAKDASVRAYLVHKRDGKDKDQNEG